MSDTSQFADLNLHAPAERRRRRWSWGSKLLGCIGIILFAVLVIVGGLWAYLLQSQQHAQRVVQAEVDRIQAAGEPITTEDMIGWHKVPDGTTDATKAWLRAFALATHVDFPDKQRLPIVGIRDSADLRHNEDDSLIPLANQFLDAHQETISATRQAVALGGECRYPINFYDGRNGSYPHALDTAELARILRLRFRVALAEEDGERAIESIALHLALGITWDHEPSEVFQWVRCAIVNSAVDEFDDMLCVLPLSDAQLAALNNRLIEIDFQGPLKRGLIGERAFGYHTFHHIPTLVVDDWTTPPTGKGKLRRPGDCSFYLAVLRENIRAADLPLDEGRARAKELSQLVQDKIRSDNKFVKYGVVLTAQMAPQLPHLFDAVSQSRALRDSAVAGIAFRRYQLKYGKPPESLEVLVPEFLAAVPRDPFVEGMPPLKLVTNANQFAIYSVGWDSIDNQALLVDRWTFADAGFVATLSLPSAGD